MEFCELLKQIVVWLDTFSLEEIGIFRVYAMQGADRLKVIVIIG